MIKSFAKINIFLKNVGLDENGYHKIATRFYKIHNFYDEIDIRDKDIKSDNIRIDGFDFPVKENLMYKAILSIASLNSEFEGKIHNFFENKYIYVKKNIPYGSGLGGGSSNAATIILFINRELKLGLEKQDMMDIGSKLGSDVNFFLSDFSSANVFGNRGNELEEFREEPFDVELLFSGIKSDTKKVFSNFDKKFYKEYDLSSENLLNRKSIDILKDEKIDYLNDLYQPCLDIYPEAKDFYEKINDKSNIYFSGSGSTFFKVKS